MLPAYFLTLAALAVAALTPGGRVWGIAAWRHAPREVAALALLAGAVVPFALDRFSHHGPDARSAQPPAATRDPFGAFVLIGAVVLFFLLRARAHYLGDGWQSLGLLGADPPFVKPDAPGTGWLLRAAVRAFGGGEHAALLAYQAVSIAAGALFLATIATLGGSIARPVGDRRRLLLFLAAGGWSLLFFGYVENYALLTACVAAYALSGARTARDGRSAWLPAGFALAAMLAHVAGVVLLPSLAGLLLARSRAGARLAQLSAGAKITTALAICFVVALALRRYVAADVGRQVLFVSPVATRFTVDGYTLFAPGHLADVLNLVVLLVPGIAPLAVALARVSPRSLARDGAVRFLGVLGASTLLAVFGLDPKLGMPRDWDLFAFAGIPWALGGFVILANASGASAPSARRAVELATALGLVVLLPRAVTNASEEAGYRQFRDHLALDHARGRAARLHAVDHWKRLGRDDLADQEAEAWDRDFPERVLVREAQEAQARGDLDEATRRNRAAIALAPGYSDPWNNLGSVDLARGRLAAAREEFEIARALNPNEPSIWMNLGTTCFATGDLDGASRWWLRAWRRMPNASLPNKSLARLAQRRGDDAAYETYLARAATTPEAPGGLLVEWGDRLASNGRTAEALAAYAEAWRRGLPDEARHAFLQNHPELTEVEGRLVRKNPSD